MSNKSHFQKLGSAIKQRALNLAGKAGGRHVPRDLAYTAHPGTLALSWTVDLDYLKACAYRTGLRAEQKRYRTGSLGAHRKRQIREAAEARYKGVPDTTVQVDCYIFYKDHSLPPEINENMAPAFNRAFHGAPLHHHFAIWRMQRPNPARPDALEFTDWYTYDDYALDHEVEDAFFKAVTFDTPPAVTGNRVLNGLGRAGAPLLLIAIIAAGLYASWVWLGESLASPGEGDGPDRIERDIAILARDHREDLGRVREYEAALDRLEGEAGSAERVGALEAALDHSRARLDAQTRLLAVAAGRLEGKTARGLPPCWPGEDGQAGPALLEISSGPDGLVARLPENARTRAAAEGWPLAGLETGQALTREELLRATAPVYAVSVGGERPCAHRIRLDREAGASLRAALAHRFRVESG